MGFCWGGVCAHAQALWDELGAMASVGEGSVQGALAEAGAGTSHCAQVGAELGEYAPGRAWRGSRLGWLPVGSLVVWRDVQGRVFPPVAGGFGLLS